MTATAYNNSVAVKVGVYTATMRFNFDGVHSHSVTV
jgi:hypothetical protein